MKNGTNHRTRASSSSWVLRVLAAPALFVGAACLALSVDLPVAQWSIHTSPLDLLRPLLNAAEPFGNGFGVAVIALAIFTLHPEQRRTLPRLLAASWGAGLVANVLKMLVARSRPYQWMSVGGDGVFDTFGRWLPLGTNPSIEQGFPSAHTATAFGLAVALSWLYPRGRWLFATLAVMVAMQRVVADIHFLSDVCIGAAVGWLVAMVCLEGGWIARALDYLERRLAPTNSPRHTAAPAASSKLPESNARRRTTAATGFASSQSRIDSGGKARGS